MIMGEDKQTCWQDFYDTPQSDNNREFAQTGDWYPAADTRQYRVVQAQINGGVAYYVQYETTRRWVAYLTKEILYDSFPEGVPKFSDVERSLIDALNSGWDPRGLEVWWGQDNWGFAWLTRRQWLQD